LIPTDYGSKLTLTETNGGTKISSTRYIQYGKIDFVIETSKWPGVVTAAITMSDVKVSCPALTAPKLTFQDEIDWVGRQGTRRRAFQVLTNAGIHRQQHYRGSDQLLVFGYAADE
jgi:hypothetical protein